LYGRLSKTPIHSCLRAFWTDEDKKPSSVDEGDDEKVEPQKQSKPRLPALGLKRPEMGDDILDIAPVAKLGELPGALASPTHRCFIFLGNFLLG
jgi:hypothetical protein